jgi:hypothetical protein
MTHDAWSHACMVTRSSENRVAICKQAWPPLELSVISIKFHIQQPADGSHTATHLKLIRPSHFNSASVREITLLYTCRHRRAKHHRKDQMNTNKNQMITEFRSIKRPISHPFIYTPARTLTSLAGVLPELWRRCQTVSHLLCARRLSMIRHTMTQSPSSVRWSFWLVT